MDYPPFFRKYSLVETGQHALLKRCVLASIESLKANGGFMDYDDRGPGNLEHLDRGETDRKGTFQKLDLEYADMSYSDYKTNLKHYCPPYKTMVEDKIYPMLDHYARSWGCSKFQLRMLWFAQYHDDAHFGWHTHEGCNMSAIYFLECPHENQITEFYGIDIEPFELEEGDLFVFPSMLPHRSRPINNKQRKTVIGITGEIHSCNI